MVSNLITTMLLSESKYLAVRNHQTMSGDSLITIREDEHYFRKGPSSAMLFNVSVSGGLLLDNSFTPTF